MNRQLKNAITFAILSIAFLFFIHHLPINHIFIDPFSEAIKSQDVMDISISKFRNHNEVKLDDRIFIINSQITDRELLSQALDRIKEDKPAAIGIDLLFDTLSYTAKDSLLSNSLRHENIVLGYTYKETAKTKDSKSKGFSVLEESDDFFGANCSRAYVNLGTQDGFTIRTFKPLVKDNSTIYKSFAVDLASRKDPKLLEDIKERENKIEWINYRRKQPGSSNMRAPFNKDKLVHYQMVNIDNFLKTESRFPPGFFKNKIILIGFSGEHTKALSMNDRYFTPLNEKAGPRSMPDMHGVIVHANIISMLLDRDFISEVPEYFLYLISFLLFVGNYFIFRKIIKKKRLLAFWEVRIVQILQFIFFFGLVLFLMSSFSIKMGFILIITTVIMSFELYEFYDHKVVKILEKRIPKLFK